MTRGDISRRLQSHLSESKSGNLPRHKWIRKHGGSNILINELESNVSDESIFDREIYWISLFENLLNCTKGGEGTSGYKHSNEAKLNMSLAKLGKSQKPRTDGVKEKISLTTKKRFSDNTSNKPLDSKAKLTYDQADYIRAEVASGRTQRDLAREFSIAHQIISLIVRNKRYVRPNGT